MSKVFSLCTLQLLYLTYHTCKRQFAAKLVVQWSLQVIVCAGHRTPDSAADAWAVADDRSTWRALRPTAGYADAQH